MKTSAKISILVRVILFVSFVLGIAGCFFLLSSGLISNRESGMLTILVTILSTLATWIITHLYSESQYESAIKDVQEQYKSNLRTYALKAAEKVNNLSNELNKLSMYLEEELDYTDYHSPEEELLAKEERIESAIHLIRTLKSVNDTALSDWEGVIGEELDQQREEKEEKEEELKALVEKVESLVEGQRQDFIGTQRDTATVMHEIEILKSELRRAMFQLSDTKIPKRISKKEPKQIISNECPVCNAMIEYKQRPLVRSAIALICKKCGEKLISRFSEDKGFKLTIRGEENIVVECPSCGEKTNIFLDNFPASSAISVCKSCKVTYRIVRTIDGVEIKAIVPAQPIRKKDPLSEEVIEQVRLKMPPQPWPTGVHRKIAEQLNLPAPLVTRAISVLIHKGIFKPQIDGIVYTPEKTD
jgi:hypothetical protein